MNLAYGPAMESTAGSCIARCRSATIAAIFSSGMESPPKSTIASGRKPYSPERNGFSRWWRRGNSLSQILDSLCLLVEEQASGVLASILLLDGDRLRHGAAPSLPKAYADALDGIPVGPSAGSCGTAAYRREQVIVEDIATDPLWADGRGSGFVSFAARLLVDADLLLARQSHRDDSPCTIASRAARALAIKKS